MRNYTILIFILFASISCSTKSKRQIEASCREFSCENNGRCIQIAKRLSYCACINGFTGKTCNIPPNFSTINPNSYYLPCPENVPNPCFNNGKCFHSILTRTINCECLPGYRDTFCMNRTIVN